MNVISALQVFLVVDITLWPFFARLLMVYITCHFTNVDVDSNLLLVEFHYNTVMVCIYDGFWALLPYFT